METFFNSTKFKKVSRVQEANYPECFKGIKAEYAAAQRKHT